MDFNHHVHLHLHVDPTVADALQTISKGIARLVALNTRTEEHMAQIDDDLTALTAEVAAEGNAVTAAVAAINGIKGQIDAAVQAALAAGATPAQLQAITDATAALGTQSQSLADAIAANTPAAPAP